MRFKAGYCIGEKRSQRQITLMNLLKSVVYVGESERKTPASAGVMGNKGRLFLFFVAQRHNQHINVHGVDQLTGGRHQFAPEVLVMAAQY